MQNAGLILPILRTDTQRELLIELLFETDRPRTLSDLARAIDVDQTTVMREVNRLRKSGMIVEERVGRSRTVKINESSPFTGPLRQLIRVVYQPLSEDDSRRATERHRFRPGSGERRPLPSSRTRS
ncbi:MAG: winged helix-turn-helix domain-containing protein [Acidimicrobiia bacterium]|nr:winged helix-turn-helix domain-containing protein [Acidimicrobiia bacterium]